MAEGPPKITVIVPCCNNIDLIEPCLVSARFADEILVVDAFSTDGTAEAAGRLADRVLQHEYVNYAAQNSWAIPQASHPWVLILDSDERVTAELAAEIRALLAAGEPPRNGYWIRRSNFLFGRRIRHSGWGRDKVLRLFRRESGRFRPKRVHAGMEMENTGLLAGTIEHHSIADVRSWAAKINRYSSWKSQDKFQKGKGHGRPLLQMLARPPLRFGKDLILRLGILDGWRGVLIAAMSAMAEFLMAAKLLELTWRSGAAEGKDQALPDRSSE